MKKQKITEYDLGWDGIQQTVICPVCNHILNLRSPKKPEEKLAWLDPYIKSHYFYKKGKGAYVCFNCLSQQRKNEIKQKL